MRHASLKVLAAGLALVVVTGGCTIGPDWLTSKWKRPGSSKIDLSRPKDSGTLAFSTPTDSSANATSLQNKATPSAKLHLAMAQIAERAGKAAEAEESYRKALEIDPKHADALVGYARLKDRQGQLDQATRLYQRASQAHPNNASQFNDLGLCLARQKKYEEAIAAMERAIVLEPKKWLYRNNAAMVLVETGDVDAAVSHLKAVQGESVAHYNTGYILQKKGDREAAREHFAKALAINPSLAQARIWLDELGGAPGSIAPSAPLIASERMLDDGSVTVTDQPTGLPLSDPPAPTLLPPVAPQMPNPSAPTPTVRRLPRVGNAPRTAVRPSGPPTGAREPRVAPLPPPSSVLPLPPVGLPK